MKLILDTEVGHCYRAVYSVYSIIKSGMHMRKWFVGANIKAMRVQNI